MQPLRFKLETAPSILAEDLRAFLVENIAMDETSSSIISRLTTWRHKLEPKFCLSIGAPSSPFISNAIMFDHDQSCAELAQSLGLRYSRYADDLAFSTDEAGVLREVPAIVERICSDLKYPRLIINGKKTIHSSRGKHRFLAGLTLTPSGGVSLGRENKRRLRSQLHRFRCGNMDTETQASLRGELAFSWSVEKEFIFRLLRQFGDDTFRQLDLPFRLNH